MGPFTKRSVQQEEAWLRSLEVSGSWVAVIETESGKQIGEGAQQAVRELSTETAPPEDKPEATEAMGDEKTAEGGAEEKGADEPAPAKVTLEQSQARVLELETQLGASTKRTNDLESSTIQRLTGKGR